MKKLPKGRTFAEFQPLKPGESKLLSACANGEVAVLGSERPTAKSDTNTVRASFIRFLALGGDDEVPVHEHGVQLVGAWIEGPLILSGTVTPTNLSLRRSHFDSIPVFNGAEIQGSLNLSGSLLPGLLADNAVIKEDVFLKDGFTATSEVRLLGAQIGGDLACRGAKLDGQDSNALSADGAMIKGSVFLSAGFTASGKVRLLGVQIGRNLECQGAKLDGKDGDALSADRALIKGDVYLGNGFTATGEVRLLGAQIGRDLACNGAKLDGKDGDALSADGAIIKGGVFLSNGFTSTGEVRLLGAQIGLDLTCTGAKLDGKDGESLSAEGMKVNGSFFFRNLATPAKGVNLTSASVGRLVDDEASWGDQLTLNGFVYGHLAGGAPTDAQTRLSWLNKQHAKFTGAESFRPQPWKQLQSVLRNMGHVEDARQVAIAFEDRLRSSNLVGQTPATWPTLMRAAYRYPSIVLHFSFKALMGYGYRPMRLGIWMVAVWLVCAGVYWWAALQGVMAPSNPLVFQNLPTYQSCKNSQAKPETKNETNWYLCKTLPEEYTGFSPLAYSLDVLLPLVNLQQETDWAPLIPTPKGSWYQELFAHWTFNHFVRFVVWFEILFGWVASLLLVAVVSGLTKRSDE
ncbi:hypothetical protein [Rhodoferax fermentans]|uniref:hypothetical protein n=1 Tax=Rhodoferax fermentans TaxID=28066 RepID=UPI0019079B3C|nr:hypothetical protein [Rhodoferax fermentans]